MKKIDIIICLVALLFTNILQAQSVNPSFIDDTDCDCPSMTWGDAQRLPWSIIVDNPYPAQDYSCEFIIIYRVGTCPDGSKVIELGNIISSPNNPGSCGNINLNDYIKEAKKELLKNAWGILNGSGWFPLSYNITLKSPSCYEQNGGSLSSMWDSLEPCGECCQTTFTVSVGLYAQTITSKNNHYDYDCPMPHTCIDACDNPLTTPQIGENLWEYEGTNCADQNCQWGAGFGNVIFSSSGNENHYLYYYEFANNCPSIGLYSINILSIFLTHEQMATQSVKDIMRKIREDILTNRANIFPGIGQYTISPRTNNVIIGTNDCASISYTTTTHQSVSSILPNGNCCSVEYKFKQNGSGSNAKCLSTQNSTSCNSTQENVCQYLWNSVDIPLNWKISLPEINPVSIIPEISSTPNPSKEKANIEFMLSKEVSVSVRLYDINGQELLTLIENKILSNFQSIELNTSDFANGTYIVRVDAGGVTRTLAIKVKR